MADKKLNPKHSLAIALLLAFLFVKNYCYSQVNDKLPTPEQVVWANEEMGVIIHYDINIYAPLTFDYGDRSTLPGLDVFHPSKLNTDQWIRTAKAAGAKYALLTVKHGTGFGLWPSKINPYNVGHTSWENGKEDILADFLASCKKYGVKPGLYYNTNVNTYYNAGNKPFANDSLHKMYNRAVLQQLNELWSNYGEMFEIWFDGGITADANTGIETDVLKMIRDKQPHAILFQGPLSIKNIIRWIGNEDGIAAYPQWSRTNATTASDGIKRIDDLHGSPDGQYWCPGESDFPIRRNNAWNGGWLWRSGEENYLFSVSELVNKYYNSVGRSTNMLIGMVVDTSGLIPKADSLVFDSLGKSIKYLFSKPLASIRDSHQKLITLDMPSLTKVSQVIIREDIGRGQHILNYTIEALIDNKWKKIANGQSVGHKRIQKFESTTTKKLRFITNKSSGQLNIKEITFY